MAYGGDAVETGMLSSEEFKEGALHFVEVWQQYSSDRGTWCWYPASNSLDAGYLAMEGVPKQATRALVDTCMALPELDGADVKAEENEDDCAALGNAAADVHFYDYHIAYHPSYSVPILLFCSRCRTDGRLLEWEEIMEDLPEASRELAGADASRWTFITQQEHPVLRTPWFSPHPCETAALMRLLLAAADADVSPAVADIIACAGGSRDAVDIRMDADISVQQPGQRPVAMHSGAGAMPPNDVSSAAHQQLSSCSPTAIPALYFGPSVPAAGVREDGLEKAQPDSLQTGGCLVKSVDCSSLRESGLRYLASWLSLVAPAVGLPVPVQFWQECKQTPCPPRS
ncbi:probable ubiquitin-like-conjugating enzyme ATG10 at N-terminal half [Coccomyxa sp. Obi]|nr:probable ubiquitin-like-conjugating enzyme ATG10 at N-terminal half [Coccomyxa sp. Obi]